MKPFRFSLQPIRVLREQKERTAQQRYAAALRACEEAAFQLQTANRVLTEAWASVCEDLERGTVAIQLIRSYAWCGFLELRKKERAAALQKTRKVMEAALGELLLAARDREALDRFHDKSRRAHDRETQREEQKALDELGVRRRNALNGLCADGK